MLAQPALLFEASESCSKSIARRPSSNAPASPDGARATQWAMPVELCPAYLPLLLLRCRVALVRFHHRNRVCWSCHCSNTVLVSNVQRNETSQSRIAMEYVALCVLALIQQAGRSQGANTSDAPGNERRLLLLSRHSARKACPASAGTHRAKLP